MTYHNPLCYDAIESVARMASLSVYPWQRVLMAMLQTAFDVSQDQPTRKFLVMAGFISDAERWVEFDGKWRTRLLADDLTYFHMYSFTQCIHRAIGPFDEGWIGQDKRRQALLSDLLDIIVEHAYHKFAVVVQTEALGSISETGRNSLGGTCLATGGSCMAGMVELWLKSQSYRTKPKYIFEDGDQDKGSLMKAIHSLVGYDPVFESKKDIPEKGIVAFTPLQAADILAYETKRVAHEVGRQLPMDFRFRYPYEQLRAIPGEPMVYDLDSARVAEMWARVNQHFIENPLTGPCAMMGTMKAQPREMIEGPQAFERLRGAMKAVLTVPKSAMPPSPFKKWKPKKKRRAAKV